MPENGQPANSHAQARGLYRHPGNRMLGGVCGGIADYLGWSEVVVRLLWFFIAMATSGAGFVVYVLLWLLLPIGTQAGGQTKAPAINLRVHTGKPLAYLLIGIGVLWLLGNVGILPALGAIFFGIMRFVFWPALLIFIGWKILRAVGGSDLHEQMDSWRANVADWASSTGAQMNQSREATGNTTGSDTTSGTANTAGSLRRSSSNRVFMGVCGGIGERYGVDPTLVRLMWAMLAIASLGLGVVAYFVAAFLLPEEGAAVSTAARHDPNAIEDIEITEPIPGEKTVHF